MTDDDIRALMEAAVPGPWTTEYLNNDAYQVVSHEQRAVIAKLVYEDHDARLIAAASDLAALTARIEGEK